MNFFLVSVEWAASANTEFVENYVAPERMVIGNVLNIIRIVGSIIALIMLAIMSIGYFTSDGHSMPGSIERKADIKGRQLTNFAIGVAVFIGATNILYFIVRLVEDIFADGGV